MILIGHMLNYAHTAQIPLYAATERLTVRVTRAIIVAATPSDFRECAMAIGVRGMPGVVGAEVMASIAYIYYADRVVKYVLPLQTRLAIRIFDAANGLASAPGIFTFLPVRHSLLPSTRAAATAARNANGGARNPQGATPNRGIRPALTRLGVRSGTGMVHNISHI